MSEASDHELLQAMQAGDAAAFAELYRRRQGALFRFALGMSGSDALADDVVQETFLTLIRDPRGYDGSRGTVASFLCGVARNHVLRRLRQRWLESGPQALEPSVSSDADAGLVRSEVIASVRAAVLALPVHYREAVVLCDLEESDYAEAAAALGCSIGTVRSRLHRGRQLLAQRLNRTDLRRTARCSI